MKGEEITIATHDTQGLGQGFLGKQKCKEIEQLFKQTTPNKNILLLQETKNRSSVAQANTIRGILKGVQLMERMLFLQTIWTFQGRHMSNVI